MSAYYIHKLEDVDEAKKKAEISARAVAEMFKGIGALQRIADEDFQQFVKAQQQQRITLELTVQELSVLETALNSFRPYQDQSGRDQIIRRLQEMFGQVGLQLINERKLNIPK